MCAENIVFRTIVCYSNNKMANAFVFINQLKEIICQSVSKVCFLTRFKFVDKVGIFKTSWIALHENVCSMLTQIGNAYAIAIKILVKGRLLLLHGQRSQTAISCGQSAG